VSSDVYKCSGYRTYNGKVSASKKKKLRGFPHVFRNPLLQIPNVSACPIPPCAIESISVVPHSIYQEKWSNDAKGKRWS
jgi:hypothetical protein